MYSSKQALHLVLSGGPLGTRLSLFRSCIYLGDMYGRVGAAGNGVNVESNLGFFSIFISLDSGEATVCFRTAPVVNQKAKFLSKEASGNA